MKRARSLIALTPLILITTLLGACSTGTGYQSRETTSNQPAPAQTATATPPTQDNTPAIKVGILLPLSGQNKALGEAMLNAAQMALFDIGSTNFELIPRDTKNTPAEAASAAQSAIQAGAQLILGPVFAHDVRAAKQAARSANINMIAFSTDWTLAGDNTFIMGFLPFDQVQRVTDYAATQGLKTAGIMSPANEYGRVVSRTFSNAATARNIKIVTNLNFPEYNPDLNGIVQSLARTPIPMNAVFMPVGGTQASMLAGLMTKQGLSPTHLKRIGTGLFDDGTLMRDPNLDGAWFAAPSPEMRAQFVGRYKTNYGNQPPRLSTLAYDATALSLILAKRGLENGGMKPAFDRASITNPNGFSGIDGIFRFRTDGTAERGLAVLEYRNGQITVIENAPQTFQKTTQ